jgi:hypothetical protein
VFAIAPGGFVSRPSGAKFMQKTALRTLCTVNIDFGKIIFTFVARCCILSV